VFVLRHASAQLQLRVYFDEMTKSDPEAERKRLAEWYAAMTNEELQQLADEAWRLTESAREALGGELSRRDMAIDLRDSPAAEPPWSRLVILRVFRDLPDALLAKSILDSAAIECFLYDENTIRMDWLWSNALGGIKLCVKEEDAAAASELLDQKPAGKFEAEGTGEYTQPRCPRCGSLNISFGEQGRRLAYATVAVGVPLPVKRGGWKCESCGHVWHNAESSEQQGNSTSHT
jgi:hypothetical protein